MTARSPKCSGAHHARVRRGSTRFRAASEWITRLTVQIETQIGVHGSCRHCSKWRSRVILRIAPPRVPRDTTLDTPCATRGTTPHPNVNPHPNHGLPHGRSRVIRRTSVQIQECLLPTLFPWTSPSRFP